MPATIKAAILVIDDDPDVLASLGIYLRLHFEKVLTSASPREITRLFAGEDIHLILLDMNFRTGVNDGKEGLYWLNYIRETKPSAAVVLLTAYGSIELAVESLKQGAADFVVKPWNNQKLLSTLLRAMELNQSREKVQHLESLNKELSHMNEGDTALLHSKAPEMAEIMEVASKVASTDAGILITGKNGTGKEVLARYIHRQSSRSANPFVSVDLGALNENLFEAELFGYKKGAFTDAKEDKPGRFELAAGGTLFLDEIGNLPVHLQSKLLTALQARQIIPVGGSTPKNIDCRVICATNLDISKAVAEGNFRQDLFFRINTIELNLPPLYRRKQDILPLAYAFLENYGRRYQRQLIFSAEAEEALLNYSWPGNIRELRHVIERAVILCERHSIEPGNLRLTQSRQLSHAATSGSMDLEEVEKNHISLVLKQVNGNVSQAARILKINRNTLYRKMEKYDL